MMIPRFDSSILVTFLIGAATTCSAKNVSYEWTLKTQVGDAYSPDCMNAKEERRSLFLAENSFPGPTIEADEGDTIIIRINNMNPSTSASIHFHGIHQMGTPYTDGASFVTQCALGPLQTQEYIFDAYPPGTHYWHDHASYNLADGIGGPIVVHPKDPEPFEYDEERIIFLQDWYIETGMQQYDGLNSWPFVWVGNPNSHLVNGKGIAPECLPGGANFNNSLLCLATCQGDPLNLVSTVNVTEGSTYRLRIINAGQLIMFSFAIAGHNLTIVQVEGTDVEPVTVDSLEISPGQRYDVLVTANNVPGSYMIQTMARGREVNVNGTAIFYYDGANLTYPLLPPVHPAWNDTAFGIAQDASLKTLNVSSHPTASALTESNVTRYIVVGTQNEYVLDDTTRLLRWAVNNISNMHGSSPLIGLAYETSRQLGWPTTIEHTMELPTVPPFAWNYTAKVNETGGPGKSLGYLAESVVPLKEGEVVEIVLQNARAINGVAEFHPWHIHGHSFWVVGEGQGIYSPETDVPNYNLVNPVLRDTVVVQPLGWVALRFVADNPGAWLFHCHIVSHHVMGMGFTLITQPDVLGDLPANVLNCNNQELDDSTHNDGDTDHSGDTNSTTNGNSTNGGKQSSGSPSMHGRWNIALASLISVILFSVSA